MTTVHHTPLINGQPANASTFNSPLEELDGAIEDIVNGVLPFDSLTLTGDLTANDAILSGDLNAVNATLTGNIVAVDATFSDDLIANDGNFSGNLSAVNATLTGNINAVDANFSDDLTANDATFSGAVSGASGTFTGNLLSSGIVGIGSTGSLTISSGVITITKTHHLIDTQSSAATDDLDTINGGSEGYQLILRPTSNARVITIRHNIGNIKTPNGYDITLNSVDVPITLIYSGGSWVVISYPKSDSFIINTSKTATIASGAITLNNNYMVIDTEGASATDELDTITGGIAGSMVILTIANNSRIVTVTHAIGNIRTLTGSSVLLNSTLKPIYLLSNGIEWIQVAGVSDHMILFAEGSLSASVTTTITGIPTYYKQLIIYIRAHESSAGLGTLITRVGHTSTPSTTVTEYSNSSTLTTNITPVHSATYTTVANVTPDILLGNSANAAAWSRIILEIPGNAIPTGGTIGTRIVHGRGWCRDGAAVGNVRRTISVGEYNGGGGTDLPIISISFASSTGVAMQAGSYYYIYGIV